MPVLTADANDRAVSVPRWAVEDFVGRKPLHLCDVCLGSAPSWDGHDHNPPCHGAAWEALVAALDVEVADASG